MGRAQHLGRLAVVLGQLEQGGHFAGRGRLAPGPAPADPVEAPIEAHAKGQIAGIRPEAFAELRQLVGEGRAGREKGGGRVGDQLRGGRIGRNQGNGLAPLRGAPFEQRGVEPAHPLDGVRCARPHHQAIGIEGVVQRGSRAQGAGQGDDLEGARARLGRSLA
ncbi:hypothetical protein D3C87_1516760 [compost metagenome]